MGMELHSRRNQTGNACKPDLEVEAKKRRRTVDGAISGGSNDGMREGIMCVVEGDMWEDSRGSKYEAPSEEEGGSECEVSLEVESDVDEKMGDGDGGGILSREGGEGRPSYSNGEGRSGGECKRRGGSSIAFRQGKGKGVIPVERDQRHGVVNRTGDLEVVLRSRCTLRTLVGLNGRMTVTQREAVKATILCPFLEYPELGRAIELNRDEMSTEVGDMVRERMNEWEREEMVSRVPGRSGKNRRFFRNYMSAMVALCDENNADDRVSVWVKIYAFMVISGVLFPRTSDDREHAEEAICRAIIGGAAKRFQPPNSAYADLASMDIYVQVIPVLYLRDDEIVHPTVHPTVRDFMGTDEFGYYVDDGEGWLSVDERLRRARDAYRSEKVAHESTKNELQMLREQVANLEGRLVTNRKGEGDGQDVSSGTAVGAEKGVGGDGGPAPGDISTAAGVMDAVSRVGQQPVSRNEGALYGVPGGVDRNEEVSRDLGREDGDGGMGLSGSGTDDREEVHVSAADACTPSVSAKHGSDRASNIVTCMKRKPWM
ncbi:hypothetical protein Cgig2_003017 [Carnegiea gigantea]|uniref:Uncharacterized protein n=1 Tax=Carnegiea gigantea TaxID=171969 RepID=A0A9Q1JFI6_9CARY|nr:hypothetical protein Cgig2_003017 [Carnegiea gigantea]